MKKSKSFSIIFASILFLSIILLTSCTHQSRTFSGVIVAKEFVPEHMSNETPTPVSYGATFSHPTFHPAVHIMMMNNHAHNSSAHKVEAAWYWYIANKKEVVCKKVTEDLFNTKKKGDDVTITIWD